MEHLFSYTNKKGNTYFLHSQKAKLKNREGEVTLYYFAKIAGKGALSSLPEGREVVENPKNGMPFIRRIK